jgi:hypothetical protein
MRFERLINLKYFAKNEKYIQNVSSYPRALIIKCNDQYY